MARRFDPRSKQWIDDGQPAPYTGATVAPNAVARPGLVSGGATSTAGAALAAQPTVFQQPVVTPAQHAATVLTPTLASQGARSGVDPSAGPAVAQALRTNAGDTSTTVGKIGPAIQGGLSGDPLTNLAGTTAYKDGGFATTGGVVDPSGPADGGTGIYENGLAVTKGANGAFKGAPGTRASLLKDAATASNVPSSQPVPAGGPPVNQFQEDQKTIAALYPDVAKAGSDANKRFVQAFTQGYSGRTTDGKDFNHQAGNTATALDLANQLFSGTSVEAPSNTSSKAADESGIAAASARGDAAAKQYAQDRQAATPAGQGAAVNKAISGAITSGAGAVGKTFSNLSDFASGLLGGVPGAGGLAGAVVNPVGSLYSGFKSTANTLANVGSNLFGAPAAPTSHLLPADSSGDAQAAPSSVTPTNPLNNLAPAPATVAAPGTTPILPPVPDPNEEAKKKLAQSSVPTFMQ